MDSAARDSQTVLQTALTALSPVDGRYRADHRSAARRAVRERADPRAHPGRGGVAAAPRRAVPQLLGDSAARRGRAARAADSRSSPATKRAAAVKAIEARINHDVKAVEYYVREQLGCRRRAAEPRSSSCISAARRRTSTTSATRACCARRALSAVGRSRQAHREAARPRARARGRCRCSRARTASRRPRRRSARNSRTSSRACGARRARWRSRRDPRQMERRGRQLQCARRRAAEGRLADDQPRIRRIAGPRAATPTRRRSSRTTGSANTATPSPASNTMLIDSVPRLLGLHLARLSAPAPGRGRSRLLDHAAQGQPDRLRERRRQPRRRERAAAPLRGQAADLALAARPHGLHRAAQPRRRARPYAHRLALAASAASARSKPTPRASPRTSTTPGKCWARRCRPCCAPPASPNGYELLKDFTRGRPIDAAALCRASSTPCRCRRGEGAPEGAAPAGLHRALPRSSRTTSDARATGALTCDCGHRFAPSAAQAMTPKLRTAARFAANPGLA